MNWIELKALNALYHKGVVKINETLQKSAEINYLINSLNVLERNSKAIKSASNFNIIYENHYLDNFTQYDQFLKENELLIPQIRLDEEDIVKLIEIDELRKGGTLEELRKQIIASNETLRGISLMFFRNEKYLDEKDSLVNALKKILDVEQFANEKDQQYIYKLECHNPILIVLCENLDFLKKPVKPREHGYELWYAGGKNVDKLKYADTRGLPIYYSCDWDYDGLFVIYPLVKVKIPTIKLLTPNGVPRSIKVSKHDSLWNNRISNISQLFSHQKHIQIIKELIKNDQWIIEESNQLIEMINS